jgi:hypothetical protein
LLAIFCARTLPRKHGEQARPLNFAVAAFVKS